MKKIFNLFFIITLVSLVGLVYLQYERNSFNNNPLSYETHNKIKQHTLKLRQKIYEVYKHNVNFPITISDKLPNNIYGMATINDTNQIVIYLNKKRFKESEEYMYAVLSHEYAHAMMFYFGDLTEKNGGHTKKWQQICYNIGGTTCERFVNRNDIIIGKVRF